MLFGWLANQLAGGEIDGLVAYQIFVLSIVSTVALTTVVLRTRKGEVQRVNNKTPTVDALQFGIKDILIWTTSFAIFFGIAQALLRTLPDHSVFYESLSIAYLAFSIAIAMVVFIWALMGTSVSRVKCYLAAVVMMVSIVVCALLFDDTMFAFLPLVSQTLLIAMTLIVRNLGFRFVERDSVA